MTREDIIRMAREAGIDAEKDTLCRYDGWVKPLERFAKLVAAHEREECAKIANAWQTEVLNPMYSCDCATAIRRKGKP